MGHYSDTVFYMNLHILLSLTLNQEIFTNNKFHELASNLVGRKIRD